MATQFYRRILRPLVISCGLVLIWQAIVWVSDVPPFILPDPLTVLATVIDRFWMLLPHAGITAAESLMGLIIGTALGALSAIVLTLSDPARRWLMPVLVISQALPVFALAPLLTLWLGYGLASKVAMATLIIYFPVTAAFYDGLKRIDPGWVDMARVMGASPFTLLRVIRIPAALPAFTSGLRVATSVAPIGAVVGEWVGASRGLGYLMLHANGRMQTDLMFAALLVLAVMALTLYTLVDQLGRRLTYWQSESGFA